MKNIYVVAIICAIILLPTVFFPVSCDISIYALGGKTLADGGKLYVDFLDLKTPGVFEIFAALYKTIGISEFALRAFDFILQLSACLLLFHIFESRIKKPIAGMFAAATYATLYCAGGYTTTMQPDSFVGFSLCLIFLLLNSNKKLLNIILIGLISGFLLSLKLTFGVVAIVALLFILFDSERDIRRRMLDFLFFAIGALISTFIMFLPLLNRESYGEFTLVNEYIKYYSSLMPINGNFLKESLKTIGVTFGDTISLLVTLAAALGTLLALDPKENDTRRRNFQFFFFIGAALFFSIAVEKRFVYYHFYRAFIPLSFFAGIGFESVLTHIRAAWKRDYIAKIAVIVLIIFAAAFSPASRYLNLLPPAMYYFVSPTKYAAYYQRDNGISQYKTHNEVAQYLNSIVPPDSLAIVFATGGNQINYYRRETPHSKFAQSAYVIAALNNTKWRSEFDSELGRAAALAVQTDDVHPTITGFNGGSYDWLRRSEHWNYVNSHFKEIKRIGSFVIFRKSAIV